MLEKTGVDDSDLDGMASIPRTIEGVDCGVTFRGSDNGFKISVRTNKNLNASKMCGELGGGGHPRAAGATVVGISTDEAYELIKNTFAEGIYGYKG
jgi:phosphoesterase RecJ-like protein